MKLVKKTHEDIREKFDIRSRLMRLKCLKVASRFVGRLYKGGLRMTKLPVDCERGFIRVENLDGPVYRIFPLWCLEESLRLRQMSLVQPRIWEDPFESIEESTHIQQPDGSLISIASDVHPIYAQCWSTMQESDTLIRAYSRVDKDARFKRNTCPRYEGVQVRSTPRKLMRALCAQRFSSNGLPYVGKVDYMLREKIEEYIASKVRLCGPGAFSAPNERALLYLLKRSAFEHESEIRLLYVCSEACSDDRLVMSIDPNELFEEIQFDPRLEPFEVDARKSVYGALGYSGEMKRSELYHKTLLPV